HGSQQREGFPCARVKASQSFQGSDGVPRLAGVQSGGLRAVCQVANYSLCFGLRIGIAAKALETPLAVHAVGEPVETVAPGFAVNNGFLLSVPDPDGESHSCRRSTWILCGFCVANAEFLIFLRKTGCPTWIRTMTKASKG